ncbi:MAG: ABC transporter ATP-binding protein [Kocuria sp.]|nr:ABC transporter ATP-binding protein [Kocuria sp.]
MTDAATDTAAGHPPEAALSVRNLRMEFKVAVGRGHHSVQAVNGLSFAAARGEVTALLGPNGAGKTTTLECAQGLLKPTGGSVELLGHNPWNAGPELRARAGVMLQDGGLPQSARPGEFLKHISSMYRHPADMAELIELLGIAAFQKTPLRRLSGGQKQRVALAAALAGDPEIVFLDEPSAGLDPQSRAVVFDLITTLKERGTAVVLTTHLLDDAQRLADHVVIVDRGTVRKSGTVAELIAGEDNPGTLRLGLTQRQRARWREAPPSFVGRAHTLGLSVEHGSDGVSVTGAFGPELLQEVAAWLAASAELPTSMTLQPRTLEDVFLAVAGREIR